MCVCVCDFIFVCVVQRAYFFFKNIQLLEGRACQGVCGNALDFVVIEQTENKKAIQKCKKSAHM